MSNKKVIIGIAAGVAALAVVGAIFKKKGYFDNFPEKANEFGENVKDKFNNAKTKVKEKLDEAVQKGTEIADKVNTAKQDTATTNSTANTADTRSTATV